MTKARNVSKSEFERQYKLAVARGRESMAREAQAGSARYDAKSKRIVVDLKNGVTIAFPCELLQGLRGASPSDLAKVELGPRGASLHWESLDADFGLGGLMSGIFGNKVWMSILMAEFGRKGGKATSRAKAAAARANGAKGGRPRKKETSIKGNAA
jgi:hypothetical protein